MTIDERLLKLVAKITRARKTTRSAFIRQAPESEIRRQQVHAEEVRHVAGYARHPVAPGEFDVWISEPDWGALGIAATFVGTRSKFLTSGDQY